MSPRSVGQFGELREKSIRIIMESALELFSEKSFHGTTMAEIAKRAGISKGLIYNYFPGKDELLREIFNQPLSEADRVISIALQEPDPEKKMESLVDELAKLIKKNTQFWKLYVGIAFQPGAAEHVKELFQNSSERFEMFKGILSELGVENVEIESLLFDAALDGIVFKFLALPEIYPIDDLMAEFKKRFCKRRK